jgi:hypothetical protein
MGYTDARGFFLKYCVYSFSALYEIALHSLFSQVLLLALVNGGEQCSIVSNSHKPDYR